MQSAISLAREAEQRKVEIEQLRNIPEDLIERVKKAGLVQMWRAKTKSHSPSTVKTATKTLQSMAYYNGSLAWVISVTNCSSLITGFISDEMTKRIYDSPMSMVGGFAGPAGVAAITEDGLIVKGNWSWGSGTTHCTTIVGGVRLMKKEEMIGTGIVFFSPDEIKFEDNWHVIGLKGTHSIDYSAESLLIPNNRWIYFPVSKPLIDEPLYRFSFLGALSLSVAAVGLGLAQRAVDEIVQIAQSKRPFGQGKPLAQRPIAQEKIGQIRGNFLAAQSLFYQTIRDAEEEVQTQACSTNTKATIRLAACHTITLAVQVVRDAYELAGGSAIWQTGKLEELHRDIHVVSQHGMVSNGNYRTAGAVFLGNQVPVFVL